MEVWYVFLENNGIVKGSSFGDEAGLSWIKKGWQESFDEINNDFCDKLVSGVAQSNGSKVFDHGGILAFGDQTEKGIVVFRRHVAS